jgi:hypothetical protein
MLHTLLFPTKTMPTFRGPAVLMIGNDPAQLSSWRMLFSCSSCLMQVRAGSRFAQKGLLIHIGA